MRLTPELMVQNQLWPIAVAALSTGGTPPTHKAVRKAVRWLLAHPMHMNLPRHMRGSWRSWPRNIGREEFAHAAASHTDAG